MVPSILRLWSICRETVLEKVLDRYGLLLHEVDNWFATCVNNHIELVGCHRGCYACCRGLFDITLLDALYMRRGFELLPESVQSMVRLKAFSRLDALTGRLPEFKSPWLLNSIPESQWDDIMPEDDPIPCILLSDGGECLIYDYRPMTCRLNGIPLIDVDGEELFDDWCTLNFTDQNLACLPDLRYPFKELFAQELLLFRELTRKLFGKTINELDTLIPAVICMNLETLPQDLKQGFL